MSEDFEQALKMMGTTQTTIMLSELDTATVMNFSEQRADKEKLRGQMATFDMIDCYNQVRHAQPSGSARCWIDHDDEGPACRGIGLSQA